MTYCTFDEEVIDKDLGCHVADQTFQVSDEYPGKGASLTK